MRHITAVLFVMTSTIYASPWPQFRGPGGTAVSDETNLPTNWSATDGVVWKQPVPKWSFSSPVVWGEHVFITGAREENQLVVIAFDRKTGRKLWEETFTASAEAKNLGPWNTAASSTPVTNGKTLVCAFGGGDFMALDYSGKTLWKRSLAEEYGDINCQHGFASSPLIYKDRAILLVDQKEVKDAEGVLQPTSYLLGVDLKTGKNIYKVTRATSSSWCTPLIYSAGGRDELITGSQAKVMTHDPATGKLLWHATGLADYVAPSPAFGDGMAFASSGRNGPTLALRPGGNGDVTTTHIEWRKSRGGPYVVSPLYYQGHLYVLSELGILECFEGKTGNRAWKKRIRGRFSGCPVAAQGKVYCLSEEGKMFVLKAGKDFEVIAENSIGEGGCMGTPAISEGNIFIRSDEHLYCIRQSKGSIAASSGNGEKVDPAALVEFLRTSGYVPNDNGPFLAAVEKLAELKYAPAAEVFPHVIRKTHYDVSEVAVKLFSELGDAAIPGLLELLQDRRDFIQWEAAAGLARLKSKDAIEPLKTLVQEGKPLVRLAAVEALDSIGGGSAVDGISTATKDEHGPVRQAAMVALGRHLGEKALPKLSEGLRDPDRLVRIKAAEALGTVGGKEALKLLKEASKEEKDAGVKVRIDKAASK